MHMGAATFQDLVVWQKAHSFVLCVYRLTSRFPREELFGLSSQLRRSAVSIPANVAEGFVKRGKGDKLRFYNISQGSLEESRYYLILAQDLGYCDTGEALAAVDEVSRMLQAYIGAIESNRRGFSSFFFWLLAPGFWLLRS
jgi:four helix bundle protein